ncbi:cytochrome-c peroxidase [Polystyrenella longa]|nr:cytochrome c peroxidase [Polystyrenella longa]
MTRRTAGIISVLFLNCLMAGPSTAAESVTENNPSSVNVQLNLPDEPFVYSEDAFPDHFAASGIMSFDTSPEDNLITNAGATLGRVLFYDKSMSANRTVSCSSCHVQQNAFSDPRKFSVGFDGQQTDRNSMALNDLRFVRAGFFWDERAESLEEAVLIPLYSHVEMGMSPELMLERISKSDVYPSLFQVAFGAQSITEENVGRALAQFIRAMTTSQSRYDEGATQVASSKDLFPNFSNSENLGKELFHEKCAACHTLGVKDQIAIFSMFRSLNNGIDADASARDGGRGDISYNPTEIGLFKASSLRNIEFTAPYMHDGRHKTLEEVIAHYSDHVSRHPNISAVRRFLLTKEEQTALVDFLKTLSDRKLLEDPRFSNPWQTSDLSAVASIPVANPVPGHVAQQGNSNSEILDEIGIRKRLKNGQSVPAGSTLIWLHTLDKDQDGSFNKEETKAVAQLLLETESLFLRLERRRRRGPAGRERPQNEEEKATDAGSQTGDFNGDGETTTREAEQYQSLKRLLEMGDGGRLQVLLDRVMNRLDLDPLIYSTVRQKVFSAKQKLNQDVLRQDQKMIEQMQELLGKENYEKYQQLVISSQSNTRGRNLNRSLLSLEEVQEQIWKYDENVNGVLEVSELHELTRAMNTPPGGFGQKPTAPADIIEFCNRMLKFDQNDDQKVSQQELPERMSDFALRADANQDGGMSLEEAKAHFRTAAFERLVFDGIYVGGAFANTLLFTQSSIEDLDLPSQTLNEFHELMASHEEKISEMAQASLTQLFAEIQKMIPPAGNKQASRE